MYHAINPEQPEMLAALSLLLPLLAAACEAGFFGVPRLPSFIIIDHVQVASHNGAALSFSLYFFLSQCNLHLLCIPFWGTNLDCPTLEMRRVDVHERYDSCVSEFRQ